ncbi:MAG: 3-dehydroquinate synthase [Oscillospiraceae bacterium]
MGNYKIEPSSKNPYPIFIGSKSIQFLIDEISKLPHVQTIVIITDETVNTLHLKTLERLLCQCNHTIVCCTIPAGEQYKNLETVQIIYDFLVVHNIVRTDLLIAFGGGVIGDMTGFVASTYMRGMDTIYLPTTLLSCVDSSIGGKTGVNFKHQKNIIGSFHQPYCVICDTDFLTTLPQIHFLDGCVEIIKIALLHDANFVLQLECGILFSDISYSIQCAILYKLSFVADDITDQKNRRFLNLGHTIGHALESKSNYAISHGKAVAVGLYYICILGESLSLTKKGLADRIKKLLAYYHLDIETIPIPPDFFSCILLDKKRIGQEIPFIMLKEIGVPFLYLVKVEQLDVFLHHLPCLK